jgi:hypothetical protein
MERASSALVERITLAARERLPVAIAHHGFNASRVTGFATADTAARAGVAVLAIGLAVLSIRAEDDDATWSPSLARAALVVSALAAAFAITTVVGVLVTDTPHVPGFTAPSP